MNIRISTAIAALGLLASGYVHAVPCGTYDVYGGVLQATACQNSLANDASDSEADLNNGNFFGYNDWHQLTRTDAGDPNSASYWSVSSGGTGAVSGTFQLAAGIWDDFASLVVVLKDGGSWHNRDYKWAAYLLPVDFLGTYNWSFDGGHKRVSHMTLYGVVAERVAEPTSLALVLTGLAGLAGLAYRRRQNA